MEHRSDIAGRAEQLLGPVILEAGYKLLLCQWGGAGRRPPLWVYIERTDDQPVGISDCVTVHEAISDLLDAEDIIPGSYELRVSSPGLERPLKRAEHFAEQLGKLVQVRTWEPIEGRRNYKGILVQSDDESIVVELDQRQYSIPLLAIERAHLVYQPEQSKGPDKNRRSKRTRST